MERQILRPQSLSEMAYDRLRDDILNVRLRPGEKLNIRRISEELGVSLVPVREALGRLEMEGFVRRVHNKGVQVAEFSEQEIREIYAARSVLEGLAVRLAVGNITPRVEADLQQCLEKLNECVARENGLDFARLNENFHFLLYRASGYRLVCDDLRRLWDMSIRYRNAFATMPRRMVAAQKEHLEIYQTVVEERDGEKAEHLMREHVMASKRVLIDHLSNQLEKQEGVSL